LEREAMKTDDAIMGEVDSLKAQVGELKAKLAALESQPAAANLNGAQGVRDVRGAPSARSFAREESRPLITHPVEASVAIMPSRDEARRLRDIVLARYPQLKPPAHARGMYGAPLTEDDALDGFCAALNYLGNKGRAENGRYAISWFVDECREWLRARQIRGDANGGTLIAAAIASGDIDYVVADESVGDLWGLFLEPYSGGRRGKGDAWRAVLDGRLRAPYQTDRRRLAPNPSRIVVMGR
jgi:hypothetical protein